MSTDSDETSSTTSDAPQQMPLLLQRVAQLALQSARKKLPGAVRVAESATSLVFRIPLVWPSYNVATRFVAFIDSTLSGLVYHVIHATDLPPSPPRSPSSSSPPHHRLTLSTSSTTSSPEDTLMMMTGTTNSPYTPVSATSSSSSSSSSTQSLLQQQQFQQQHQQQQPPPSPVRPPAPPLFGSEPPASSSSSSLLSSSDMEPGSHHMISPYASPAEAKVAYLDFQRRVADLTLQLASAERRLAEELSRQRNSETDLRTRIARFELLQQTMQPIYQMSDDVEEELHGAEARKFGRMEAGGHDSLLRDRVAASAETFALLLDRFRQLKIELNKLQSEDKELREKVAILTAAFSSIAADKSRVDAEVTALREQCDRALATADETKAQLAEATLTNQKLQEQLAEVEAFFKTDQGQRIQTLERELAEAKLVLAQSEQDRSDVKELRDKVAILTAALNSITTDKSRVDAEVTALREQCDRAIATADESKAQLAEATLTNQKLHEQLIEVEGFIKSDQGQRIKTLERELAEAKLAYTQSEHDNDALESELHRVRNELDQTRRMIFNASLAGGLKGPSSAAGTTTTSTTPAGGGMLALGAARMPSTNPAAAARR